MDKIQLTGRYGASEHGNFSVIDTIGVPHPYCITPKHVVVASDHHSGMLNEGAIIDAERRGARCHSCKGKLRYEQHETALLVECHAALKDATGTVNPELHAYLLACRTKAEEDKFAGFAFIKAQCTIIY